MQSYTQQTLTVDNASYTHEHSINLDRIIHTYIQLGFKVSKIF